ncbi:MAG: type II toxin-antitoxin system RelE/ParE family toxin [Chloroflexi bacterium]|nr:type II toxin-antitoxin system RelE/ParE family toxin [Chloroflexota bacterium]
MPASEGELSTTWKSWKSLGLHWALPNVKHLDAKIWELRVVGRIQHRILYFAAAGRNLVLLHAFTKKTQQTARAEIDVARGRMADYQRRYPDEPPVDP